MRFFLQNCLFWAKISDATLFFYRNVDLVLDYSTMCFWNVCVPVAPCAMSYLVGFCLFSFLSNFQWQIALSNVSVHTTCLFDIILPNVVEQNVGFDNLIICFIKETSRFFVWRINKLTGQWLSWLMEPRCRVLNLG